jgi:hypothetical protein
MKTNYPESSHGGYYGFPNCTTEDKAMDDTEGFEAKAKLVENKIKAMSDIDKWCAEQCGVDYPIFTLNRELSIRFTIQDPRCREIVREHFKIDIRYTTKHEWHCTAIVGKATTDYHFYEGTGKTIAEAEIACITAIWEASK